MNYAGQFDATFASEGPGTHSHAYAHVDSSQTHAPADAIIVPDAQLLFHADYSRSGTDLILSRDHHEYVVYDYFHGEKRAPLASPDGAHLTADIVKALVGEVEVSQAGAAPAASQVIGHVTKLQGSATVIRNGVSIILNMGDNVEKGDVVESGANSTVGITFIDGTVFGLSANARMVLNEMVYDPNGSSNSSLLSLVAGTITFVAGETAKHGDMKIDTPVATMGIRGTAVLVEIDFTVPGQSGQPNASFQVLVEPDGTTGSYILFDKNTLQPIAIVNQAGQQININNGIINITTNPLSPDLQKLITDVFQQKFTDNTNPNTKSTAPSTDSIVPTSNPLVIKVTELTVTPPTVNPQGNSTTAPPTTQSSSTFHVSGAPIVHIGNLLGVETSSFLASGELQGVTGSSFPDGAVGIVSFNDINVGDTPSVSAAFGSFTYKNAHGQDVTGGMSSLQLADIAATEVQLTIIPGANNTNIGSAIFTYSIADHAFDFLAAGEQITLTYFITVNENYAPDPTAKITLPITITITGTNDVPVITTSAQTIAFTPSGTKTVGGDLQTKDATSGTLAFTDVDLTDTHTVATKLTSAVMSNGGTAPPLPDSVFEAALSAEIGIDSTGTGAGTIDWQLSALPVYLSDFIPPGQTLTLTYTITVTDSQGATSTQTVTVTITGNENPAVVWIHTTTDGHDNLWTTANNWETGTVPTSSDDVIIITDQLHPNTPAYPVTIDGTTNAAANSVTMNDFVNLPPELDVLQGGSLTITDALSMSADSILNNAGTVSVGGAIELLDSVDSNNKFLALNQSVIVNSGTLNLGQGGDFQGSASITNTGTIDLTGGVLNVLVDIANSGTDANGNPVGGQITVESKAKLALGHDANNTTAVNGGITGGTLTIIGELDLQGSNFVDSGTLSNSGNVFVTGAGNSFDAETITNTGTIEVKSGAALAIDQGSSVSGSGTITIDGTATLTLNDATIGGGSLGNSGTIDVVGSGNSFDGETITANNALNVQSGATLTIDQGSKVTNTQTTVDGTLTLNGASITGGTVTNNSDGEIDLTGTASLSNGTLHNAGKLKVSGTGNALHGETVNANNELDIAALAALTINQNSKVTNTQTTVDGTLTLNGASITGGTVTNNSDGEIDLTGTASLSSGTLHNAGKLKVSGTGNALHGETVNANNELDITALAALAIDQNSNVTNTQTTVDGTLTLDSSSIRGGTVTNNADGEIDLDGTASLSSGTLANAGKLKVTGAGVAWHRETVSANNALEIVSGGVLTIDQGSKVTNTSLTIDGGGSLQLEDTSQISGGTLTNAGDLSIEASTGAALKGVTVQNAGGTMHVDINTAQAALIVQDGTTISGGTLEVGGVGTLDSVSGSTALHGVAVTVDSGGLLESTGGMLTIDTTTATTLTNSGTVAANGGELDIGGEAITNYDALEAVDGGKLKLSSLTVTNSGTITVDQTSELDLNSAGVSGGNLNDAGTVDHQSGTDTITAAITNSGTFKVTGGALTLNSLTLTNWVTDPTTQVVTNGTVSDAAGATIDLIGAIISGGTVTLDGTLSASGTSAIHGATIDVHSGGLLESTAGGTLTVDTIAAATLTNSGTVEANGGELDITTEAVANNNALQAVGGGKLKLNSTTVTDANGGTVTVDNMSELDLASASILDGTLNNNGGTLDSLSGSNTISAAVTNTGTIEVKSGTLDLSGGVTGGGRLIVDAGATLELGGSDAETVTLLGAFGVTTTLQLDSTSVPFNGTIIVNSTTGGTLDVTGQGSITTSSGDALDFNASGGTSGVPATMALNLGGTIIGHANGIVVKQTGTGDVSVTTSGSVQGLAGNGITVQDGTGQGSTTGFGNITVDATGQVTGMGAGSIGLQVQNYNAANSGNINVTATGGASGDAYGIDIDNAGNGNITLDAGGTITTGTTADSSEYGIRVVSEGTGSETVTTDANTSITSDSSGINVANLNDDVPLDSHGHIVSNITVNAYGTIHSGSALNLSGSAAGGIYAGYRGAPPQDAAVPVPNVYGNVTVNNHATITADSSYAINAYNFGNGAVTVDNFGNVASATGYGIDAYNYENGDVSVTDEAGATVTGAQYGIVAAALGGDTGNVTVTVEANATIAGSVAADGTVTGTSVHAIVAENTGNGNVTVTTSDGDVIKSNSSAITAYNSASTLAAGTMVSVTARGTINSGTSTNPNSTSPGGIEAGYFPGSSQSNDNNVAGNVFVDSYATIIAAAGFGIDAYNWGTGNVVVTAEATSSITASGGALTGTVASGDTTGIGIGAYAKDGGSVNVTQVAGAIDTGLTGLSAETFGKGTITITNHGQINGQSGDGILVNQQTNATGSTTITNSGTVTGTTSGSTAVIVLHENATGVATIDNSGTIGAALVAGTSQVAIYEDGGNILIDNTGTINGTINVANGTFTNEAGGVWNDVGSNAFGTSGGTGFTINNYGTINLSNGASISGAASLTIDNTSAINSIGTDSISGAGITNTGSIDVNGGSPTLTSTTVTNSVTDTNTHVVTNGTVSVADGATLKLSGTEIIGGIINDNSSTGIDVTGSSKIDGNATLNDGGVTVESNVTLTLDNVTVNDTGITDKGTVELADTVKLTGGATIQGQSNSQLGAITNLGLLEILGAATLLDVTVTNTNHNIQVDANQILDFDNSTITSGTLTVSGELNSTGTSFINNATIINQSNIHVTSGTLTIDPTPVTNSGTIEVAAGATLAIDGDKITNHSVATKGAIQVDGQATLDLQDSEIDGGNITIDGELDSSGHSTISGATIVNDGVIDVTGGTLTIDATSVLNGTGGFKTDGGSLVLNGALVGNVEISDTATVELGSSSSSAYSSTIVTFDAGAHGTLKLDHAEDFGGKVAGFSTGQTLDFADISYASKPIVVYTGNASGGVLAVYVNGQDVANINLTGNYTGVQWVLSSDSQGGTDIRESTEGVLAATLDHSTAQQGVTMHVTGVTDGGTPVSASNLSYAWQMSSDGKSWTTVGTLASFTPGEAQEGHFIQLVVTDTDAKAGTTQDVVYQLGMPNDLAVTVDQTTAQQGLPIHVTGVTDGGTAVSSGVAYLWETSTDGHTWTTVGHSSSYAPSFTSDGGKQLQLVVSYADPGESESVTQSFGTVAVAKEWTGGSHSWETSAAWSPTNHAGAPTSTDDAVVDATGHYTVTVDQSTAAAHSLVENASQATVEIAFGGKLTLGGNLVIDQGNFQVDFGGTLKDTASSAVVSGSFTNNGTVEAGGGKLEITDAVSGLGGFKIDTGATLQLDHASSESVTFSSQGTLALEDPTHFTGIISDSTGSLTDKDVLDLAGFDTKASVIYVGGTSLGDVVVSENGKVATIAVGANTTHWTKPVSDGHGGILIEDPVENDAAPNASTSHAWSITGADSFVFKTNPGANAALDAEHSPVWPEPDHPDSTGKLAQFLQTHDAAGLPNLPGLLDSVTPDSLKTQLLSHHNEFHFV